MVVMFKLRNQVMQFCTFESCNSKGQQRINGSISILCKQKRFHEALQAFETLRQGQHAVELYPSTYADLFIACSSLKSLHQARAVHTHLLESGSDTNVVLHNHMLNAYGKCGSPEDARRLFNTMPEKNIVSWTSMISGFSQNYREREAVEFYVGLLRSGMVPDQFALGGAVRASSIIPDFELGKQTHCHFIKLDRGSDVIVQNALVSMYSKADRIGDASIVFDRIVVKDVISWGSMISGFAQQGHELEALHLFKDMISTGVYSLNEFHFGSVFSACGGLLQLCYGEQLHALCFKFGLESNNFCGCSVSDMYSRCGKVDHARRAFDQIQAPDLVSWNSIISALSYGCSANEAILYFSRMRYIGLKPDSLTIQSLLCACMSGLSLSQGELVHSHAIKTGLDKDIKALNSLLSMYTKCSDLNVAMNVFRDMNGDQDIVSWNAVLTACLQHHHLEEALWVFKRTQYSGNDPDHITLNLVLSACAGLAYLEMSNQVFSYGIKAGLDSDLMFINGLIDTYSKCGSLVDARKIFELAGAIGDVFSWTSLIVGYAQFGYSKESLELFVRMQGLGMKPNIVTFVGVLTACSRDGLVDEGLRYYEMMHSRYGIVPTREHCSCVVNLLARAGRLKEAEWFVNQNNFEADAVTWKAILAACRLHGDMDVGKRAAEGLLKLEPSNSGALALLCNLHASSGCWSDLARLRKLLRSIGVKKSPGKSWIELKGEVKVFIAEDMSHAETEEISQMMEILSLDMIEEGYLPD